jgi:hypothetical protein
VSNVLMTEAPADPASRNETNKYLPPIRSANGYDKKRQTCAHQHERFGFGNAGLIIGGDQGRNQREVVERHVFDIAVEPSAAGVILIRKFSADGDRLSRR